MESQGGPAAQNRKRAHDGPVSSDESAEGRQDDDGGPLQRGITKPHTFKACNECRQQKLRCDVQGEPGQTIAPCSRCKKHKSQCRIDLNFKRVKKRGKYEELQREVEELRAKLAEREQENSKSPDLHSVQKEGLKGISLPRSQRIEDISLSGEKIAILYHEFLTFYNPSLPLLDPEVGIDHHFNSCPLLGWTIVIVAARRSRSDPTLFARLTDPYTKLLWATISTMPQAYDIVRALCFLCTWPLPDLNSSVDRNFLLSGIMMRIALQNGLHRPAYAHEFGKSISSTSSAEVRDRTWVWVACNIVAQRGTDSHPSHSIYDWTLGLNLTDGNSLDLPEDLLLQLKVEKYCEGVSKSLYQNPLDPLGIIPETEQAATMSVLRTEYQELGASLVDRLTPWNKLCFLAAGLQLYGFAFLIPRTSAAHSTELLNMYDAATLYIQSALEYEANTGTFFLYSSFPLQLAMMSACCALLKLLNSSFAVHLNLAEGKTLFNSGLLALRNMSVKANDLAARMAEGLSRMWRAAGSGKGGSNSVGLHVRSRMSSNHVYDCIWSWKQGMRPHSKHGVADTIQPATTDAVGASLQHGVGDLQPLFDELSGLSQLEDYDLLNSFDWVFDDYSSM